MTHAAAFLVLSLALASTPASAGTKSKSTEAQTKYCIRLEASTGTRMSKIECRTKAEWEELGVDVPGAASK